MASLNFQYFIIRLFDVIPRWRINLWWLKKWYNRVFIEGKILIANYLYEVTTFATNSWKLIAIRDLWWLYSKPVTVQNATLYFLFLSWHFCLVFYQKNVFIFISFFDEISNFHNRILTSQKQKYVIKKLSVELYIRVKRNKW